MYRLHAATRIAVAVFLVGLAACGDSGTSPPPDARIATLDIAGIDFDRPFDPDESDYQVSVGFLTNAVSIAARPIDPEASILIDGLSLTPGVPMLRALPVGTTAIAIEVVNRTSRRSYLITMTRSPPQSFAEVAVLASEPRLRESHVGTSLDASGATIVAGAPFDSGNARGVNQLPVDQGLRDSGAAYVFVREVSSGWAQLAYLKASNADAQDTFGRAVAIDGDTLVVGAPLESSAAQAIDGDELDNSAPGAGAAYVFVRDGSGAWTQQAYLKASDAMAGDQFGTGVAIHDDTIAVSGRRMFLGVVYLFRRDARGSWSQEAAVSPADAAWDIGFGDQLAVDGDTLAVGAKDHRDYQSAGAVYVYRRDTDARWTQEAMLTASNAERNDTFGGSLALNGNTLAVGAMQEASAATGINGDETDNSTPFSGAAYVFTRSASGVWLQQAYIKASNTESGDDFGYALDLSGDWLAVGAENEGSAASGVQGDQTDNSLPGSGAAYLYARDPSGIWSQQLYVKAAQPISNVRFGRGIAFIDRGVAIAVPFEGGGDATTQYSGAVHVFE